MSLDDKVILPTPPVEPTQKPEIPTKARRKRRRNEGGGATFRRSKRLDGDDDSAEASAVLTLSSDDGPRRALKRMLFEPDDGGPAAAPAPKDWNGSTRTALSMTAAAVSQTVPPPLAAAPAAPGPATTTPARPSTAAPTGSFQSEDPEAVAAAAPAPDRKEHPIAIEDSAFFVATPALGGPEPPGMPAPDATDPGADARAPGTPAEADGDSLPSATADAYDRVAPVLSGAAADDLDTAAADVKAEATSAELADSPEAEPQASSRAEPIPAMRSETPPAVVETMTRVDQPAPAAKAPRAESPEPKTQTETPSPSDRGSTGLSRSEAIARSARMSALSGSRTAGASASPTAARSAPPPRRAELPKHPGDLFGYWTRVKNGRRFPSRADFDVEQVAENLPNSMLLTCGGIGSGQVSFSSILRLGGNRRSRAGEDLTFNSMITEWILTIGGEAARAGTPVQDTEVFPSSEGSFAYKIVALPLSDQQSRVDHVLCHLSRS